MGPRPRGDPGPVPDRAAGRRRRGLGSPRRATRGRILAAEHMLADHAARPAGRAGPPLGAFRIPAEPTPAAVRVIRFDFHPTTRSPRPTPTRRRLYRVVAVPPPDGTGLPRDATWPSRCALADAIVAAMDGRGPCGCCRLRATWKSIRSWRSWAASWPVAAAPRCRASPPGLLGGRICPADARGTARRLDALVRFYQGRAGEPARPLGLAGVLPRGTDARVQPRHVAIESKRFPMTWTASARIFPPGVPSWRPSTVRPPGGSGRVSRRPDTRATPWHSPAPDADRRRWRCAADRRPRPWRWAAQCHSRRSPFRRLAGRCTLAWVFTQSHGRASGIFGRLASGPRRDRGRCWWMLTSHPEDRAMDSSEIFETDGRRGRRGPAGVVRGHRAGEGLRGRAERLELAAARPAPPSWWTCRAPNRSRRPWTIGFRPAPGAVQRLPGPGLPWQAGRRGRADRAVARRRDG